MKKKSSKKEPSRDNPASDPADARGFNCKFSMVLGTRQLVTYQNHVFYFANEMATFYGRQFWVVFNNDGVKSYLDPACVKLVEYEPKTWTNWKADEVWRHPDSGEISLAK